MPAKFHVKKGDQVVVIAGSAKGRRGKVAKLDVPRLAVVLEGTDERSKEEDDKRRLIKPTLHHLRKSQQHPQGGLLWLEGPIHVSNVMTVANYEARHGRKTASK
jgi:large subunit ribosomal protein L24